MGWRFPAALSCLGCKRSAVPGRRCSLANDQGHNNSTEEAHRVTGGTAFPVPRSVKSAGLCLQPCHACSCWHRICLVHFPQTETSVFSLFISPSAYAGSSSSTALAFPRGNSPITSNPYGFHFKGLSLKSSLMFL